MSNAYFLIPVKATSKMAWVWEFTFVLLNSVFISAMKLRIFEDT